ncbi:hypothetical protein D3C72_1861560 [compost metagenome]
MIVKLADVLLKPLGPVQRILSATAPPAALEESTIEDPVQATRGYGEALTSVIGALTYTLSVYVQPLVAATVTLYQPALPAFTTGNSGSSAMLLKPLGPVQV